MHKLTFIVLFLILCGCREESHRREYVNKSPESISLGEQVSIYYYTNSCCHYCFRIEGPEHLKLIEDKIVDPGPDDCNGCDHTGAFVFEGVSRGVDTVKLWRATGGESCDSIGRDPEIYVVEVQ